MNRVSAKTRMIVETGLVIALSVVLNLVTLFQMPQGGSVSLVMLPIFVFALRRGPGPGVVAGVLYGVVDALLKPYVVHPAQFLLDYPLAYGLVGLAGLFARSWERSMSAGQVTRGVLKAVEPGIIVGALGRYAAHVISGVVYFSEYAGDRPVLAYSALYNTFVLVSALGCAVAAPFILRALARPGQGDEA